MMRVTASPRVERKTSECPLFSTETGKWHLVPVYCNGIGKRFAWDESDFSNGYRTKREANEAKRQKKGGA